VRWRDGGVLRFYLKRSTAPPLLRKWRFDFSVSIAVQIYRDDLKKLPVMVLLSNSFAVMALLGFASAVPELKKRACPAVAPQVKPVMMAPYTATVVAKGFKTPREMVFDPLGNMLVINQGGGGLSRITWTDNGGLDVCSSSIKTLVNDATVRTNSLCFE
jgi:hypothetical protein